MKAVKQQVHREMIRAAKLCSLLPLLWLTPPAVACGDAPSLELVRGVEVMVESLNRLDHKRVVEVAVEARAGLGCVGDIVAVGDLANLYLYEGIAHFRLGATEAARVAFSKAVALEPDLIWDQRFEPSAASFFETTREWLAQEDPGDLYVRAPETDSVFVDGARLWGDGRIQLLAGVHVVQRAGPEGVETQLVSIRSGESISIEVGTPARLLAEVWPPKHRALLWGSVGVAVSSAMIGVAGFAVADQAASAWQLGDEDPSVVRRNHLGMIVGWVGLGVGISVGGAGVGVSLWSGSATKPSVGVADLRRSHMGSVSP